MSRITDSIKALKAERRSKARELRQIDGLLSHFETLTAEAPKRHRKAVAKPKPKPAIPKSLKRLRQRPKPEIARTASLTAAAQAD